MLKWFSISGIATEIKRIRWPKRSDLVSSTSTVVLFCIFFGLFFVACEFFVTFFLKFIGIGV